MLLPVKNFRKRENVKSVMGFGKRGGSEVVGSISEDTLDKRGSACAGDGSDWGKEIHSF